MTYDEEGTIIASWLAGDHLDDLELFSHMDFEHFQQLVKVMQGDEVKKTLKERNPHYAKIARESDLSPGIISQIIGMYSRTQYESYANQMCEDLANKWMEEHKGASIAEMKKALERYERFPDNDDDDDIDPVDEMLEEIEARHKEPVIETGITDLDRMLNGIRRKELTAIGARPSVGKSAFCQQVAMSVAKQGERVLYFPLEMSREALVERIFMRYTDFSQGEVKRGLSDEALQSPRAQAAIETVRCIFREGNLKIFERCNDLQNIRKKIRKYKPHMIIIDQLEQLKDGNHSFQDKRSRFSHMTHELQAIALDMNVAVWFACQVNRAAEGTNSPPTMANLKESGTIEEDSDNVILLHRVEEEKTENQGIRLELAKQRSGECGTVGLVFVAKKYAFYGLDPR